MRILGPATALLTDVQDRLIGMNASGLFIGTITPALWKAGLKYAVNPVGMVAQSYKETGGGKFGGNVKAEFCNPCGLKIRYPNLFPGVTDGDRPLAHAMFPTWDVGAEAHAQHLRCYAGCPVDGHLNVDPRWAFVVGRYQVGTFEELGGKWAPSPSYGVELVQIANKLAGI